MEKEDFFSGISKKEDLKLERSLSVNGRQVPDPA